MHTDLRPPNQNHLALHQRSVASQLNKTSCVSCVMKRILILTRQK